MCVPVSVCVLLHACMYVNIQICIPVLILYECMIFCVQGGGEETLGGNVSAKWHMGLTCHIFTATSEVSEQIGLMTYNKNVQPPRDATEDTTSRTFVNCKCMCCFSF